MSAVDPAAESAAGSTRWHDSLQPLLPRGEKFTLLHITSYPKKVRKLVFTSKSDPRLDSLTTHYYVLSHENALKKPTAVYALELLSYESEDFYTLFVSKADTSGYYAGTSSLNIMAVTQALLRETVLRDFGPHKAVRICLFAKADGQYLLLGSVDNPRKHILPDAALVKWWIRCLDGLGGIFEPIHKGKATLEIPGLDASQIATYFPASPLLPWTAGDIFWVAQSSAEERDAALAVNRIPRFPDDPKSRFLDSLVTEMRAKTVSRKQYWLELESRQEFRLGKSVGIIGLEGALRSTAATPHGKDQAMSNRETHRFKEFLISLNFKTAEASQDSTERLLASVPEYAKTDLQGSSAATRGGLASATVAEKRINTLGLNIMRKKRKN